MIRGSYFDGITSKPHSCEMSVDANGRVALIGVDNLECDFLTLTISSRVGNTARLIRFADGSRFETLENNAIDELIKTHKQQKSPWLSLHIWESKLRMIVLATIITAVVLLAFFSIGLPTISKTVAHQLPHYLTNSIAQEALESLENNAFEKSELSTERQTQLRSLLLSYVPQDSDFSYQLLFRKSERFGANAMALPNGIIIFTDELVELAQFDQELVSVMLHEIGHIEHRHSLRNIIEAAGLYAMYSWLTGDVEVSSVAILAASGILLKARYSRGHESEADDYSLNTLLDNNINPLYFASIMAKLSQDEKAKKLEKSEHEHNSEQPQENNEKSSKVRVILDYLSSHPPSSDRINTFKKAAKDHGYLDLK